MKRQQAHGVAGRAIEDIEFLIPRDSEVGLAARLAAGDETRESENAEGEQTMARLSHCWRDGW
jgi:hypothetical protein